MALVSNPKKGDDVSIRQAIAKLGSTKLGPTSTPTFGSITTTTLTISGLTTNSLVYPVSGLLTSLGAATNGQIPIGSTGVAPVLATLTEGAGIDITNAAGSVTIATTITQYTDELAQDAVGGILDDGTVGNIVFTYDDAGGVISAFTQDGEINHDALLNVHQDVNTDASPTFAGGEFTGAVTGVFPTDESHLATKSYVDAAIGARTEFFLSDTASGVGSLNYAYTLETGQAQSSIVSAALGLGNAQLIKGFITEAGEPGTITIREGVYAFHFHAKKGAANQRIANLYFVLSRVDADGTSNKITIATSDFCTPLTEEETACNVYAALGAAVEVDVTSRLILDVYVNIGIGAQPTVVTLYMEGLEDSYFSVATSSEVWQTQGDVLDDLNIVGPVTDDSYMLVGSAAGVFAWETGATLLASVGAAATAHVHNGDTLQLDGINSDGGAFSFNTTATVTFNQSVSVGTGELTCGSINRVTGTLTLEIGGVTELSLTDALCHITPPTYIDNGGLVVGIADTNPGVVTCYGAASGTYGGRLYLHVNADADDVLDHYFLRAQADDCHWGDNVNGDIISIIGSAGAVSINKSVTLAASCDLTMAGHIIFNTNNSYIGFADPRITFNDTNNRIEVTGAIMGDTRLYLLERADDAGAQTIAGYGQVWVKNTTPNELWFTDDAGTDVQLGVAGGADAFTVKVDAAATAGYLGAASNDGVLRTSTGIIYTDGGDFVTLAVDVGITDDDIVQIDSATVADNDYAKFTANGLEGREASEVITDLGLGLWISPAFDAANFSASASMTWTVQSTDVGNYSYMVIGKTMFLNWNITYTTVGGTLSTQLYIKIPGGYSLKNAVSGFGTMNDNSAANVIGMVMGTAGGTRMQLYKDMTTVQNWSAATNTTHVYGVMFFEIN
ncbi:MAG: hypothetical protein IMZ70_07710 [Candidatus Atribacteria bacterium]|nr:hypothetical protein [Candidatus Atribacteria bacterium]